MFHYCMCDWGCLEYGNALPVILHFTTGGNQIYFWAGHSPEQSALGGPAWAGHLDQMTSRGPLTLLWLSSPLLSCLGDDMFITLSHVFCKSWAAPLWHCHQVPTVPFCWEKKRCLHFPYKLLLITNIFALFWLPRSYFCIRYSSLHLSKCSSNYCEQRFQAPIEICFYIYLHIYMYL